MTRPRDDIPVTAGARGFFYAAQVNQDREHSDHEPANGRAPSRDPARVGAAVDRPGGDRREPTLGWLGDLRFDTERGDAGRARGGLSGQMPRWPRWWLWLAAVVVLALLLAVLFRHPLADRLWPQTRAQALRQQAALALAQGRLTAEDGSGARQLYEAALAIDPDRSEARTGLMRVAQTAMTQARTALADNRFADAHRALRLARELSVPRAQADVFAARLRQREAAHAGIDRLLSQAAAARKAGRLDRAVDAALPLYQRVLALQPERIEALEGREDALAVLLQQARRQLQRGALVEAASTINTARDYDSGHVDLPAAESLLARAVEQALQGADRDLRRGRLQRAAAGYRSLLQLAPEQLDTEKAAASRGLERVAAAWAQRAERFAADFGFADAEQALQQARALAPDTAVVREASRHVARAKQAQARLGAPLPTRDRKRQVRNLLVEAAAAEARGDLLTPPGDSAFDKLRAARAIAPTDAAVQRASARLLPAAKACFERELRGNNLGRARACLDARIALEGDSAALRSSRRRLALRWLAVGDERLGAGELQSAASALSAARSIDPAAPGLDDFAERLRVASASDD